MTEEEIHLEAIEFYGNRGNIIKAVEEMSELTQALCKRMNEPTVDRENIREEIADVTIMMERLALLFGPEKVNAIKEAKLERLMKRMGMEDEGTGRSGQWSVVSGQGSGETEGTGNRENEGTGNRENEGTGNREQEWWGRGNRETEETGNEGTGNRENGGTGRTMSLHLTEEEYAALVERIRGNREQGTGNRNSGGNPKAFPYGEGGRAKRGRMRSPDDPPGAHITTDSRPPSEEAEQMRLILWARANLDRHPELALLHHIPNGGKRGKAEAGRFKAMGVQKGVPDLCLPVPRGKCHGLYIEMKRRRGGTVSEPQQWWLNELRAQGYRAEVCKGWEAARDAILEYLEEG